MSLPDYYQTCALPKPEPRRTAKRRADRKHGDHVAEVRQYVFARERNICRCCRFRQATSLHEIKFKSQGGKVSRKNSVALCGDGVQGCHGFCQRHEITVGYSVYWAEAELIFTAVSERAAEWMHIKVGEQIVSPPMHSVEREI